MKAARDGRSANLVTAISETGLAAPGVVCYKSLGMQLSTESAIQGILTRRRMRLRARRVRPNDRINEFVAIKRGLDRILRRWPIGRTEGGGISE